MTIESLLAAKIRIWMLTGTLLLFISIFYVSFMDKNKNLGDKRETAINIAQSSSLVKSTTKVINISNHF